MCVVIHMEEGSSIDKNLLFNAVYNNPHGWGFIVLGEEFQDGIYVEHNDCEETDPKDVWEAIKKFEKNERVIHLRYATVGAINKSNVHPFKIYGEVHQDEDGDSEWREAWFMHNGTLTGYGSQPSYSYYHDIQATENDLNDYWGDVSDSKEFAMLVLDPYMERWNGDYKDYYFQKMLKEFWSHTSRGIIVSNYDEVYRFGDKWYEMDSDSVVGEVWASNDSYFKNVTRGPEHERRQEALRKLNEEKRLQRLEEARNRDETTAIKVDNPLVLVDWETFDNPPMNFDRLKEIIVDAPLDAKGPELFTILRALTNDELVTLLASDYADIKEDKFEPETAIMYHLLWAYMHFLNMFVVEIEKLTGKTIEDIIDGSNYTSARKSEDGDDDERSVPFDI